MRPKRKPRDHRKKPAASTLDVVDPSYGEEDEDFVDISQRVGAQDNSSNKNTAKNTDGTASEAPFGFSGRAPAPFTTTNKSLSKKSSVAHHKTERPGKPKRRDRFEDHDALSTG